MHRGGRHEAEFFTCLVDELCIKDKATFFDLGAKEICDLIRVAADEVKDKALKVRGTGDIHRWRRRRQSFFSGTRTVVAGAEEFIEHVIFIGCHDEAVNRQAHLSRNVACADIAKVTGRNRKGHLLFIGLGDFQPAVDVVDDLRHQTCPVNGVHRTNAVLGLKLRIRRYGLDHVLAVIKDTVESNVENIRVIQTKHLGLLESSHAARRGQHENANALASTHGVLRRRTGITRGCAQDIQSSFTACELIFKKLTEKLHRHIFKRCGRPFRKVTNQQGITEIGNRNNLLRAKFRVCISPGSNRFDVLCRNIINEKLQYLSS